MIPHAKIPGRVILGEPKPDDSFVDNTVYRYKMINGEKVLIGTQDPFPEGWFDPEGWRRTKTGEEEDNMAGPIRPAPDYEELKQALREHKTVYRMSKHYHAGFTTVQKWLLAAGLIDKENKPIESGESKQMFSEKEGRPMETEIEETSKGVEVLDSIDAGKKPKATDEKCRNCGRTIPGDEVKYWHRGWMCNECAGSVLDASLKPDEAEPPDASPDEFNAGEVSHAMPDAQTPVGEPAGSQYEPEDNDYLDEIEQVITAAANRSFERKGFVLEVIANIIELAEVRRTPAELTVELIDAVLVVA